jgi:hypothetical protein
VEKLVELKTLFRNPESKDRAVGSEKSSSSHIKL